MLWHTTSSRSHFYLNLAQRVKYFCCHTGSASFTADPKTLFIHYYYKLKALPLLHGKTRYQALRHFLSSQGLDDLKKVWNASLPSKEDLQKNSFSTLRSFSYHAHLATLIACVCAGALAFENPLENRVFALSCFQGDIETMKIVWSDIQSRIPQRKLQVLQNGIFLALEGKQPQVIWYLKSEGNISVSRLLLSNYKRTDFVPGGPYVEMAEFLVED